MGKAFGAGSHHKGGVILFGDSMNLSSAPEGSLKLCCQAPLLVCTADPVSTFFQALMIVVDMWAACYGLSYMTLHCCESYAGHCTIDATELMLYNRDSGFIARC